MTGDATRGGRWRGLARGYAVDGYAGFRALVLGAGGFVGRHVAHAVYRAGCEVVLVVRDPAQADAALDPLGVRAERAQVDLADDRAVDRLIADTTPDLVFNLAGQGVVPGRFDDPAAQRINAELPLKLLGAMGRHARESDWPGQRLVHVGSGFEYGRAGGALRETGPVLPMSDYARTKLEGTLRTTIGAEKLSLRAVVARLFTVYGPGEPPHRLTPSLLEASRSGQPLPLTAGTQLRDFTYVQDVAAGLLRIGRVGEDRAGIVNLATGRSTSVRDFAELAARVFDLRPDLLRFGERPDGPEEMVHEPVAIDRLRGLTGWCPPTGLERGLRTTAEFAALQGTAEGDIGR